MKNQCIFYSLSRQKKQKKALKVVPLKTLMQGVMDWQTISIVMMPIMTVT